MRELAVPDVCHLPPLRLQLIAPGELGPVQTAAISLIQPVDLYSKVDRSVKYGFLFIGFTFLVLLMFDVIGGIRVSPVEYLLMGAALVLFFVLLLALAEVIGFTPAYLPAREFGKLIATDDAKLADVMQTLGLKTR